MQEIPCEYTKFAHLFAHMGTITETNTGYRAFVQIKGVRESSSFRTQREAKAWIAQRETELRANAKKSPGELKTLKDAFTRYKNEVTPTKKGQRFEALRIERMIADDYLPMSLPISQVTTDHLGQWRDSRLKIVKPGSVLRDINIISNIFTVARREWKWITVNPMADMRKPPEPAHRKVIYTKSQIRVMLQEMGYSPLKPVRTVSQACAVCWLVACRTGARQGELCAISWDSVSAHSFHVSSKTEAGDRDIPLLPSTSRLIEKMRGFDPKLVFGIGSDSLSSQFRKYRQRAGLGDEFTFHDSRHYAATHWAQKIDVLTLCKIFGWADPKEGMTYYQPDVNALAKRLSKRDQSQK